MKFKNKLLSILTSSVVAVSSLAAAIGCTCTPSPSPDPVDPEDQPWDIGVTFKGESQTIAVNNESPEEITFDGFELSTTLAWGETMSVELTNSSSENVELVYFPTMPEYQFDIRAKLKNKPTVYTEYKFGLIFRFYVNGVEKATKLIDNFCIEYTAGWRTNNIHWKQKAGGVDYDKTFNLAEGQSIYYTDYFYLDHALETPREKLEIDSIEHVSGPDDVTARIDQIDGTKVKVLFELADPSTSSYAERAFTIKFKFIYDNVQQGELIPIYNFKIVPKEPYVAPHIKLTGTATESLTLQTIEGTTGVYINSQENATKTPTADRYFYLEDDSGNPVELGADDEIKVIDNKANVNTTCFVNTVPDTASEKSIYIDLMCSFNDVYDPYVTDKSETFNVTFQFYHLGELVSEQTINTDITLKYTPLPSVAVESKQFGIVFEPVEIDQDGDFNIDFVGRIGKKDSQSWEESELHKGEYLTLTNDSYSTANPGEPFWNLFQITRPAVEYSDDDGEQLNPLEAIEGTDEGITEITFSVFHAIGHRLSFLPTMLNAILYNSTILTTRFYDEDPIANPAATPTSVVNSTIDFIHYPEGYWKTDSVTATDTWIADRTLAMLVSYQTTPGDESTRVTSFGNVWFMNPPWKEMNRNDLAQYDATVVTSRDFYEKIKPIFSMDSDATKAAGVRVGLSNKTLTRKYIGAGSTSYITPDDFIYLRPSACIDEPESEPENQSNKATMAYTYRDEDQSDFLWDKTLSYGSNVAAFTLCVGAIINEEDAEYDPWAAQIYERNSELARIAVRSPLILKKWMTEEGHEFQMTNLASGNCIDNWDNWACALCSGFTGTTIKVNGVNTPALYWMTHEIKFDYGHLPEYCSIEQSLAQKFSNLGTNDDKVVKHASSAYKLPDAYSKGNDPENIWFSDAGTGAMFVIREWDEYGKTLKIPRVAGINWNGGNVVSGTDSFYPWIDLFYDNGTNLLEKYVYTVTSNLPENFLWF